MKPIRPAAEIAAREAILAAGVNLTAGGRQALEAEVARAISTWMDQAADMHRTEQYYRSLLLAIGRTLGHEAYVSDDGSIQDEPLCAKLPKMVERRERHLRGVLGQSMPKPAPLGDPSGHLWPEDQAQAEQQILKAKLDAEATAKFSPLVGPGRDPLRVS